MKIFNGKEEADKILADLGLKTAGLDSKPGLAVILAGDNPESKIYINLKKEAAKKIGINFFEYYFKETAKEKEIIDKIESLNKDNSINGILVQLPLPNSFNVEEIIGAIESIKDVDGFNSADLPPVLPSVILFILLKKAGVNELRKKKILALVSSDFFGNHLKDFLNAKGIQSDYLILNESRVEEISKRTIKADIIITACGKPGLIKGEMVKEAVVLIDAGFTRSADGKIRGNVDKESVKAKASFLTPVPGGVGPLTVAFLLKNVYLSFKLGERVIG